MKKRFQKRSLWKIVFSLFCMGLLLTNCQEEEIPLTEMTPSIDHDQLSPSVKEAKLNFEQTMSKMTSNAQQKNQKKKPKDYFVHWSDSRTLDYDTGDKHRFLYTPILFDKKNRRSKSFLATLKINKSTLVSQIFTIAYHNNHTNKRLSGYVFEKELNGKVSHIHNYENGIKVSSYHVSWNKSKSTLVAKEEGCELTEEDWIVIMEMLEASGGGSFNLLDCVVITASSDDQSGDYDPDLNYFPPVPNELSEGGNSSGTSSASGTQDATSTDQWWHEETEIDHLDNEISIVLMEYLPPLNTAQKNFVNNPDNNATIIAILNFLQANEYSMVSQNFALMAIDGFINGDSVDFNEMYIETSTPDDNFNYQGLTNYIPNPIILNNGDKVSVKFGITNSDGKSANQKVSIDLIEGLKFALENANNNLNSSNKITSIYIMATTNGRHSSTSNHANGTAIDISRINGVKMVLSGVTSQIKQLQNSFDSYQYIRENFGPYFKHKYTKENRTWNYNYPVGGHKDHIHVSIRK